jgi:hypothetical protein
MVDGIGVLDSEASGHAIEEITTRVPEQEKNSELGLTPGPPQQHGGKLLDIYGDIFGNARDSLLMHAAGKDITVQEIQSRAIDAVRDELAGPNPTPLERILCERVALCWFDAYEMDRRFINQSGMSIADAEYRESRRDRAHRRFLSASKTLATVRRLTRGGPAVAVNVAQCVSVGAPARPLAEPAGLRAADLAVRSGR